MSVVAGLDIGTQSVKLLVYDTGHRRTLAVRARTLALDEGHDGSREQHPAWWITAAAQCFADLDAAVRTRIVAIGVSGQQHGFVPLDAAGEVLAPAKLWCDTSSWRECDEIMAAAGGYRQCIALAGNPILAGYTASKLPWTRKHRPDVYRRLASILLPHDYVNFWLTGERWMECGDASGTGWLDVRTRRWSSAMLAATDADRDLSACLPPLVDAHFSAPIAPATADALGLSHEVRVSAGGGDNMMAAIGTGNVAPGILSVSLGTSGTLFASTERPLVDDDGVWAAFCSSTGGGLPLICTMNCTVATGGVAEAFGLEAGEGDRLIEGTAPGADGLSMLPFFNGERTPDLPSARASLRGMNLGNFTRAHVYRAAMEGATYALRHGLDALCRAGLTFQAIRLTGGGANSAPWRQMVADVFGLPVEMPAQTEGAAFGAALQALWAWRHHAGDAVGIEGIAREHVALDESRAARPDAGRVQSYREPYQQFLEQLTVLQQAHAVSG
ncbi:xylulokinase [Rhodanobacter sp. OR87]|uniref:xylulokinase n=1 Tax=Rhodanobacter sp. OR87 TaxID=1076523 RepID=UPI00040BBA36|nr:xylulokinase [Rhodanobacter sp. OR87]